MTENIKLNQTPSPISMPKVAPTVSKPIEVGKTPVAKEVKPVAEAKDPMGMFDYSGCKTHVVKDGETLYDIAQQYAVALQQLRYFNHLNKKSMKIRTGQTLYIPNKPVRVPTGE